MRYLAWLVGASVVMLAGLIGFRFAASDRFGPDQSGLHGLTMNEPTDILFVGSSHTRQSYDARQMEEALHRRVYLLAFNGLDPVGMVPVLRDIFGRKAKPRLCVIEVYSATFGRPHAVQDSRLFFEADPALKAALLQEFVRAPRTEAKMLDAFSLLVNQGNETIVAYPLNRLALRNLSYHGGYGDKFVPGIPPAEFGRLTLPLTPEITGDPEQVAAIRAIVAMAREAEVSVAFVESPLPGPVASMPGVRSLKKSLASELRDEEVPYLDGQVGFPEDDAALFADNNHLSTQGRALFTRRVAAWLTAIEN